MDEEKESVVATLIKALGVHRDVAMAFVNEGHTTVEEIAYVPLDELLTTRGLNEEKILFARSQARTYLSRRLLGEN